MRIPFAPFFFIYCITLFGCKQETRKDESHQKPLQSKNSIERQIQLDSTILGVETVVTGLDVPWEIAWGPDNWIWFTEQGGRVSKVNPATGEKIVLLEIPDVFRHRTLGLLGMAVHHDQKDFPYVFLNYTYRIRDSIISKLVRYDYKRDTLRNPLVLLEIPGNTGHNGSRLTIAPDDKIIWATGDALDSDNAQNVDSFNGKILRLNLDGTIPQTNPFPDSPVWSWGYRNHQGLAYGSNNILYTSEHGNATDDEINLIRKGGNYGHPEVTGYIDSPKEKMYTKDSAIVEPLIAWTPTIAPAGIGYYNSTAIPEWKNSILLVTLKENDLRVLRLNREGKAIISESIYLDHQFGRLRDITISPMGDVFIATSNRDWNPGEGYPKKEDDRIIRIFKIGENNKASKKVGDKDIEITKKTRLGKNDAEGRLLYNKYCASCHKKDGQGITGAFPSLRGAEQVQGSKEDLIQIILYGQDEQYDQPMPSFDFLEDEEIAEILTYIRSEFGNGSESVSPEEIRHARKGRNK